ncbi:MAG TPA: CHAT domain-containing protein, partial [Ktedonobacteraceae bacterium]|nr:CHAT domain-containing protein [Ktedonobacteraceae bacterium]
WPVDDQASYLLIVRFVQEWLPCREQEPPAIALARAQAWLRSVTNADLATWQNTVPMPSNRRWLRRTASSHQSGQTPIHPLQNGRWRHIPVRGRQTRFVEQEAQLAIRLDAQKNDPMALPYADPYYWAGFQLIGW